MRARALLALAAVLWASSVSADEGAAGADAVHADTGAAAPAEAGAGAVAPGAGPLATAAAIVPGVLVHGAGHFVAGDRETAARLAKIELAAVAAAVLGAAPLGLSGASRRLSWPLVPLAGSAAGVLLIGWAADIYGAAGVARIAGRPRLAPDALTVELGYAYIYDPQFDYRSFALLRGDVHLGAWRLGPRVHLATGDDNQRVRLELARRVWGARPGRPGPDGTYLALTGALTAHHYGDEAFTDASGELSVDGRLDLVRVAPTLRGSFAELGTGLGLEVTDYHVRGAGHDVGDLLVLRFGWGVYLGDGGEVALRYDHRRDDLVGGLATLARANGFIGSIHLDGRYFWGRWGVHLAGRVGSAYVAELAVAYRGGLW